MKQNLFENIQDSFLQKWQDIADLIASIIKVPAALIMKTDEDEIEVFTSSSNKGNPYKVGDKENLQGLYCETVIKSQKKLHISNALKDKNWDKNPDIKLGMIAYLGFPINFPDQTPFGTLCVLDKKERQFNAEHEKLLLQFKKVIEIDLALFFSLELNPNSNKNEIIKKLLNSNNQYQIINEEYLAINEELKQLNSTLLETKQKAEENELKFQSIFENSSVGIAVISLDFKIINVNTAYCNMLGYSEKELIGKSIEDITHPETANENHKLQAQLKNGEISSFQLEKTFIHKNGQSVYGLLNACVIKNIYDKPIYFLGSVQDITEKKIAERALIKSERELKKVQEITHIGSWYLDIETNNVTWTEELYKMYHLNPSLPPPPYNEHIKLFTKESWDILSNSLENTRRTGIPYELELQTTKNDGSKGWIWVRGEAVKNQKGETFALWGVAQDITERKNVEIQLKESEERFKALHNASFGGITIHDKGVIIECNQGLSEITGFSLDELIGMNGLLLIAPESRDMVMNNILTGYEKPYEAIGIRKNGDLYPIRLEARNIPYKGKMVRTVEFRDITESKEAEKKLRKNEEMLLNSQSLAHICAYSTNLNLDEFGKSTWICSPEFYKIFGIDQSYPHTLDGWIGFIHPDYCEEMVAYHKYVVKEKLSFNKEYKIIRINDGKERWVRGTGELVYDDKGNPIRMHGAIQDITEYKNIENELKEKSVFLSTIMETSPVGIVTTDKMGIITYANNRAEQILGLEKNDITSKTYNEPSWNNTDINGNPLPNNKLPFYIVKETLNTVFNIQHGITWTNGNIVILSINASPIIDNEGSFNGMIASIEDITELKQAEKHLIESEERFQRMLALIPDMISIQDPEMNIIYSNWNGFGQIEKSKQQLGSKCYKTYRNFNKPCPDCKAIKVIKSKKPFQEEAKLPNNVWVDLRVIPVLDKNGEVELFVEWVRDITQQKNTEQELIIAKEKAEDSESNLIIKNQEYESINEEYESINEELTQTNEELLIAKEKAEENNRLKTAFLQNMSHEIRTPMNAICGFSDFLSNSDLSAEKRKSFISIIQNSSNQLLSIVTDILTISALETKQEKINIEKVCINNIIVDLLAIFKQQSINQNISLYAKQQLDDKQSEIYTDKTKITQILSNLITNALKFTHEGFVEFGYELISDASTSEKTKTVMQFYVKDTGIGIKPEYHEKIFERFRQANKSTNKLYGGTGLGLAISKGFVEMLDGKIWVNSDKDKGSTFYFTIPYNPIYINGITTTPSKQDKKTYTLLIAEDEELNYLYLEELFNGLDCELIHTKDGQETIDICKTNKKIDLILMDIKMPIMNGYEAAKIIKEIKPHLPIIAQSAYALEHEIERYSKFFDDYLTKPINKTNLKEKISKYLDIYCDK
jgi:PAS domain S-box-containing protein